MSNVIPEAIIRDVQTISALVQGQQDTLINDQGKPIELVVQGESECGGLILAFDSPHSLSFIEGEYDHECFLRSMDPVRTTAECLFDNTYLLSTEVIWEGVEPGQDHECFLTNAKSKLTE